MSGKDHLERTPDCAQNSSSFNGDVLQLYKDEAHYKNAPRGCHPSGTPTDHIDFSNASDPYQTGKQHSFDAKQQSDIYKQVRGHDLDLHSFIKSEHKALSGSENHGTEHTKHPHEGGNGTHEQSKEIKGSSEHHGKSASQRLITQQTSIFKNANSGDLSESEFVQIEKGQHKLEGLKTFLQKDGSLSTADRKELNHAIDAQWGQIKALIHNSNDGASTVKTGGSDNPSPTQPNPGDTGSPTTPAPGDIGSPPGVAQLINPNHKYTVSAAAKSALNDTPNPISVVQVEGNLPTVPVAMASRESLKDMPRLEALGEAYKASNDEKYADKAKDYLLAWARTNHSTGNPINDAQLYNTINTYALIKDSAAIQDDPTSQKKIETYLKSIANTELKSSNFNMTENWNAHRIELIANIGFATNDKSLISQSMDLYKNFLGVNIQADGSTNDFHKRDALHYQNYDLEPLLRLAEVAGRNGYPGMFDYASPNGGSLRKAVNFELPYITGAKTHLEFQNSKIAFDKQRADAGVKGMAIANFKPSSSEYVMQLATDLDSSYKQYDKYVS